VRGLRNHPATRPLSLIQPFSPKNPSVSHTDTLDPQADGFWANKTTWNARWVKYWRAKKIYEPVWKKVWTPTIHNEWVPLPNAPNEWEAEKGHSYQ